MKIECSKTQTWTHNAIKEQVLGIEQWNLKLNANKHRGKLHEFRTSNGIEIGFELNFKLKKLYKNYREGRKKRSESNLI